MDKVLKDRKTEKSSVPDAIDILRRKHVTIACDNCRKMKTKCNCEMPCSNCKKYNKPCVYSPRKKRGPVSKMNYGIEVDLNSAENLVTDKQVNLTTSAVQRYLAIFLSTFASITMMDKFNRDSFNDINHPSSIFKLQLFAALSCSCRACGDITLANSMLFLATEVASQVVGKYETDQAEDLAIGLVFLSFAHSIANRSKGIYYIDLSKAVIDYHTRVTNSEPGDLSKMIGVISFNLKPLIRRTVVQPTTLELGFPNIVQGHLSALSETSYSLFSNILNNPDDSSAGYYVDQIVKGSLANMIEFFSIIRTTLTAYCPLFGKIFEVEKVEPEYLTMPENSVPPKVCAIFLRLLELISCRLRLPDASVGITFLRTYQCFLYCSLQRYDLAVEHAQIYLRDCIENIALPRLLLSPVYSSCPCLIQITAFLLRMNLQEDARKALNALACFEQAGFSIATSALAIFRPSFSPASSASPSSLPRSEGQDDYEVKSELIIQSTDNLKLEGNIREDLDFEIEETRFLPSLESQWDLDSEQKFTQELESILRAS